jgi:hypothetical protein
VLPLCVIAVVAALLAARWAIWSGQTSSSAPADRTAAQGAAGGRESNDREGDASNDAARQPITEPIAAPLEREPRPPGVVPSQDPRALAWEQEYRGLSAAELTRANSELAARIDLETEAAFQREIESGRANTRFTKGGKGEKRQMPADAIRRVRYEPTDGGFIEYDAMISREFHVDLFELIDEHRWMERFVSEPTNESG